MAKHRIQARIDRLTMGNPDDTNSASAPIVELRIDHGPGYRVYVQRGAVMIILLCGGDKSTQAADIKAAHRMLNCLDTE
ncbi:type II toxin-antitoxin system RelE/ParE family toxin [Mycetohabitans sp. B5]|uniref:Putative addiction module killer protein n=1 Tax=Mycetohabitans endofungorum TaxID=417203 RepID=A0A2P5K6K9_9BURK|nr:type II toxin-antitoxin system RelE/ParE family toxin [Mycetohabitans sp. B5]PPB80662.1 putative addiction module killer protein [Mycetohabitans endofungorum]